MSRSCMIWCLYSLGFGIDVFLSQDGAGGGNVPDNLSSGTIATLHSGHVNVVSWSMFKVENVVVNIIEGGWDMCEHVVSAGFCRV